MKTPVLCNQKGGVGKSAVATLLSHHLAHRGQRVPAPTTLDAGACAPRRVDPGGLLPLPR